MSSSIPVSLPSPQLEAESWMSPHATSNKG